MSPPSVRHRLKLALQPGEHAVCRLEADAPVPEWATRGRFFSVTRTPDELSIACETALVPAGVRQEGPWRALSVQGQLDFNAVGVLVSLAEPLAAAGISILAIATFDTDHVLVRTADLPRALAALRDAGHDVSP